jgi:hypothetical protein
MEMNGWLLYPLNSKLGGPHSWCGHFGEEKKISFHHHALQIMTVDNFCRMALKMMMMMKNCCKQMKLRRKSLTWFQNLEIKCVLCSTSLDWIKSSLKDCYWCRGVSEKKMKSYNSGLQNSLFIYFYTSVLHFGHPLFSTFLYNTVSHADVHLLTP